MDVIKVSANSRTSAVAGAIAGVIREHKRAEVQAIGAGAVNQAVKALVLATGYLKNDGIDITLDYTFDVGAGSLVVGAAGTWIAAALTPVLVTLISEALHRPTERVARAWTLGRPGGNHASIARRLPHRRPDRLRRPRVRVAPRRAEGAVQPADGEGLPRLRPRHRQHRHRRQRRARVRRRPGSRLRGP